MYSYINIWIKKNRQGHHTLLIATVPTESNRHVAVTELTDRFTKSGVTKRVNDKIHKHCSLKKHDFEVCCGILQLLLSLQLDLSVTEVYRHLRFCYRVAICKLLRSCCLTAIASLDSKIL